jgi:Domain of unknown function (DUF4126)/Bacterial PH domain
VISGLPWGLALASGVNTYLPLFLLALFARFGHVVNLASSFQFLASDQALIILGALAASEILAQKFPGLDNVWDLVHTLLRPLAGAVVAGATLTTHSAVEMAAAMLVGAVLSTAAHSAKSTLRVASTAKTLGTANVFVSFGEDAAVVAGTLLSLYAPWIMLGIVVLFVAAFVWFGPPLARRIFFNLRIVAAWFSWLGERLIRAPQPLSLRESLDRLTTKRLKELGGNLAAGEEIQGALDGWKRTRRGPRRSWLAVTQTRLLLIERRGLGKSKVQSFVWDEVVLARHRNLWFFERLEMVTRDNHSIVFNLRKAHGRFGAMAAEAICRKSEIAGKPTSVLASNEPGLAPVGR